MRSAFPVLLAWALSAPAGAAVDAEAPSTREVSGEEMSTIRAYSRDLGKGILRDSLGIDLDQWQLQWDTRASNWSAGARVSGGGGPGDPRSRQDLFQGFRLKLEQTDDLRRFLEDQRDLPFGLELSGSFAFWEHAPYFQTRVWLPLSWRDEIRAEASVPVGLFGATEADWWRGLGLGRTVSFRSDYRNRLGLAQMQAGLGTQWLPFQEVGYWHLDYDYHLLFGQGSDEAIHWLKLSRPF